MFRTVFSASPLKHVACLLVVCAISGCPGGGDDVQELGGRAKTETTSTTGTPKATISASDRVRRSKCEQLLVNSIDGLSFDRLNVDADPSAQMADLNNWMSTCGPSDSDKPLTNDRDVRANILPPVLLEETENERFTQFDLTHVRDAKLSQAIGDVAATDPGNDVQLMVDLFQRVVQNTTLVDRANGDLPLDPFQLWQMGIASERDRVWLFSLLLKQYQIDTVAIDFPSGFNAQPYLLVAAIPRTENAEPYLFDPILGLPIPAADDDGPFPTKPATWNEAMQDDGVFRSLDRVVAKYPLRSDRLKTASLFLVGSTALFSPRMAVVQNSLPTSESVELYDGLGDNQLAEPPLLERVTSAFDTKSDTLGVWAHPFPQRLLQTQITPQVQQLLQSRAIFLAGPYKFIPQRGADGQIAVDPNTGQQAGIMRPADPREELNVLEGRVAQLTGDTKKALKSYLAARIADPPSPENLLTSTDAAYWSAVTQYESDRSDTAERALQKFLDREFKSIWEASARRLLARIKAENGEFEDAARLAFNGVVEPGLLALVKRWKTQGRLEALVKEANEKAAAPAPKETDKPEAEMKATDDKSAPEKGAGKESDKKDASDKKAASKETKAAEPETGDDAPKEQATSTDDSPAESMKKSDKPGGDAVENKDTAKPDKASAKEPAPEDAGDKTKPTDDKSPAETPSEPSEKAAGDPKPAEPVEAGSAE